MTDRDLTPEEALEADLMELVLRAPLRVPTMSPLAGLVAELVEVGLLVERCGRVWPTAAAVRYGELLDHAERAAHPSTSR